MATGNEKRRETRGPIDTWIEVERGGELYFQRAANISVGGAYFAQTIPLPLGTQVKLKFSLPGEAHQITCQGEIVSAKDLGMGVQFVALAEADRVRIERYLEFVPAPKP